MLNSLLNLLNRIQPVFKIDSIWKESDSNFKRRYKVELENQRNPFKVNITRLDDVQILEIKSGWIRYKNLFEPNSYNAMYSSRAIQECSMIDFIGKYTPNK